jgi:hypothetical protein
MALIQFSQLSHLLVEVLENPKQMVMLVHQVAAAVETQTAQLLAVQETLHQLHQLKETTAVLDNLLVHITLEVAGVVELLLLVEMRLVQMAEMAAMELFL